MKLRFEPFGAWARLDTLPALVALDRDAVRALGYDGGAVWAGPPPDGSRASRPLEVHLAVTGRCSVGCSGCYLDARPDGTEPTFAALVERLDRLRDDGVFTVAFGGGEPTLRGDLLELAEAAHARGLTPVLTTSGIGLTAERAKALVRFAQVNVSYDGEAGTYAAVRGVDGARHAERAIELLRALDVRVGVNVVLTRTSFPRLEDTLLRARALGAVEGQLLRYKPAGRAARLDYLDKRLTEAQIREVPSLLRRLVTRLHEAPRGGASGADRDGSPRAPFALRIDCALVPFLVGHAEAPLDGADLLARFAVFGCEADAHLAAVTADGNAAPCSFATSIVETGPAPFRARSDAPPEPCASCSFRRVCRGGCAIVAHHIDGSLGPDPECPRVRAHRAVLPARVEAG
jgi:radical SAM protein with 4Fe4S-binding SPASM domain